jgi:hypothetical protein
MIESGWLSTTWFVAPQSGQGLRRACSCRESTAPNSGSRGKGLCAVMCGAPGAFQRQARPSSKRAMSRSLSLPRRSSRAASLRVSRGRVPRARLGSSASSRSQPTPWAARERLLAARCPPAVTRLVVSVRVDAVESQIGRRLAPHVTQKGGKAMAPLIADADASAAVIVETCVAAIFAARDHSSPRPVFGRSCFAVRNVLPRRGGGSQAPARSRPPITQIAARGDGLSAAVAATRPPSVARRRARRAAGDHEQAEALPSEVNEDVRHRGYSSRSSRRSRRRLSRGRSVRPSAFARGARN